MYGLADKTKELKGYCLFTDRDIFSQNADISTATEAITGYISFSVVWFIPKEKKIQQYLNNKFCMTMGNKGIY